MSGYDEYANEERVLAERTATLAMLEACGKHQSAPLLPEEMTAHILAEAAAHGGLA